MSGRKRESINTYSIPLQMRMGIARYLPEPAPFHYTRNDLLFAIDFKIPVGTPVLSALGGIVEKVRDGFDEGKYDKKYLSKSNFIILKHDNDEYTKYVHLHKGIPVKQGDLVFQGQLIGFSGLSGYADYPHLHFEVGRYNQQGYLFSVLARFEEDGRRFTLRSPKE
ncbi:M23 family metallopeptidase [Candidatus Woesearchaeota archaeon]|nr:M23 family metallopeptidase [Candidatus Woesearchaeota archaeon]